jgi:hemoglobin
MTHLQTIDARERKTLEAEAIGIDPAFISELVDGFYAKVRGDAVLGPIFAKRVIHWPHHLAQMKAFWTSVLYQSGGFSGNPMLKHIAIPNIGPAEFAHWLDLFGQTLDEIAPSAEAHEAAITRARTIAQSLMLGIRIHRDRETLSQLKG